MNVIPFSKFKNVIFQKEIDYRYEYIDETLSLLMTDANVFDNCKDTSHVEIVIRGDYGKGAFAMLLTKYVESGGNKKRHLDEVVGEIDSDQDNMGILRPLALKLRTGLLNCNTSFSGIILLCVCAHNVTSERKGFFSASVDQDHTRMFRINLEVNFNGDIKFQMMMIGRSGHDKDWCLHFRHNKSEWTNYHLPNDFDKEWFEQFPLWTTQDIVTEAIKRDLEIESHVAEGKTEKQATDTVKSFGVKEPCVWPFLPVTRHVYLFCIFY